MSSFFGSFRVIFTLYVHLEPHFKEEAKKETADLRSDLPCGRSLIRLITLIDKRLDGGYITERRILPAFALLLR